MNLKAILGTLKSFQKAMGKQNNIAKPIKEGTPNLQDVIKEMQSIYKKREASSKPVLQQVDKS